MLISFELFPIFHSLTVYVHLEIPFTGYSSFTFRRHRKTPSSSLGCLFSFRRDKSIEIAVCFHGNMDSYRSNQSQDYGILRKKDGKEEELFVFGYSCRVYEDYDKSLYIDQGKHLIPWLGDDTLKIDRFVIVLWVFVFIDDELSLDLFFLV